MSGIPYSSTNNYNAVETLAGYKIDSGNIGDFVYKDTEFTLALKPASGGGPVTWNVSDGVNTYVVNGGDTIRWIGGANTTIQLTNGGTTKTIGQSVYPSGANREIQICDGTTTPPTFSVGTNPAKILTNGDIQTTTGTLTGEVNCSGIVPSQPLLPDTYDGASIPVAGHPRFESKIYKLKLREGTLGINTDPTTFNQKPLAPYNVQTIGSVRYGFPCSNDNIMWTGTHHGINIFNAIIGWLIPPSPSTVILAYPTGGVQPPGTNRRVTPKYGTTDGTNDTVYYDPLNLRCLQGGQWAATEPAGDPREYQMGYNPTSLGPFPGILKVYVEVVGKWSAAPPDIVSPGNLLDVYVRCAENPSGALRWDDLMERNIVSFGDSADVAEPVDVNFSICKVYNTYDNNAVLGYDRHWEYNDLISVSLQIGNEPSASQTFTVDKFQVAIEYVPNP